jgi:cell division protein ZapA (FtsZ GTPase activity inhibitor)
VSLVDATHNVDVARRELLEAVLDADEHRFRVVAGVVASDDLRIILGVVV